MFSINNYNILNKIGEGGMSVVYLAEHKYLHKLNALKKLALHDKIVVEKFIKEAQILYSLQHNYIVKVEDCFDFENNLYIVIEYIKGLSLTDYIKKQGRIEQQKALEIFKKILYGVQHAHSYNIIHRDIKPSNIMIDENDDPKILDFGIAKIINTGLASKTTSTFMNIGSPAYMSPEQYKNDISDLRTDIYSLGIVLYEMLTGVNPYLIEEMPIVSLGYKIVHEPLPDPKIYLPEINNHCRDIIIKCTRKNRNERYNNCKEIIENIENLTLVSLKNEKNEFTSRIQKDKIKILSTGKRVFVTLIVLALIAGLGLLLKYKIYDNKDSKDSISINNNDISKNMMKTDEWKYSTKNKNLDFHKIRFNDKAGWMYHWGAYYRKFVDASGLSKSDNGHIWKEVYKTIENTKISSQIVNMFFIDDRTGWIIEDINKEDFHGFQYNLLKTTNGGEKWRIQMTKLTQVAKKIGNKYKLIEKIEHNDLNDLYFVNTEVGFVSSDGCIYKTVDGGDSWKKYEINELKNDYWIDGLFFINSEYGWACSLDGIILKTIDGGESWQTVFTNYKKAAFYQTYFINSSTGWTVGNGGIIIKTVDGGNNWTKQFSDAQNPLHDILFLNENTGWIVGEMGTLLKTTSGGEKWEYVTIPTRGDLNSIAKSKGNKIYIACDEGGILTLDLSNK